MSVNIYKHYFENNMNNNTKSVKILCQQKYFKATSKNTTSSLKEIL
jgi:hypothetical protein